MSREEALHYYLEASRFSFADRNAYLGDSDFVDVPLAGLLSDCFAAERRSLITQMAAIEPGRRRRSVPLPGRRAQRGRGGDEFDGGGHDHPPHRVRPRRKRGCLHVHDRVHRRQRDGGARLGILAEQRADRLQLQLDHAPQPRRGRQAAAQLDEPDDRPARRRSPRGARVTGRVDDHHHGAADPRRPPGPRRHLAGGDRRSPRHPARHLRHTGRSRLPRHPGGGGAERDAATSSRPPARSAPPPASSSSPTERCSQPPNPSAAAAAARWWSSPTRPTVGCDLAVREPGSSSTESATRSTSSARSKPLPDRRHRCSVEPSAWTWAVAYIIHRARTVRSSSRDSARSMWWTTTTDASR